jgi:hypothetical protein
MRKFLMIVGTTTILLVAAAAVGLFFLFKTGTQLDAESKSYAEESVAAITSGWNRDEFLNRALPAVRDKMKPDELKNLFEAFRAGLGRPIEFDPALGQSTVSVTAGQGKITVANYQVNARFDKGPATVRITLIKTGDKWMIQGFFVDSAALVNNLAGRPS